MQSEQKDARDCMSIYHPNCLLDDRLKALINDIIPFFSQVEAIEQEITFSLFKQLWKDYRLLYLTSCLHKKEDKKEFLQLFYGVLLNKMIQSNSFSVQTVCVMGLFTLFQTQSESDRERIDVDFEALHKFKQYLETARTKSQPQGSDILKILLSKHAFVVTQKRGIKNIVLDKFGFPLKKNSLFETDNIFGFTSSSGSEKQYNSSGRSFERRMEMEEEDDDDDDEDDDDDDDDDDEDDSCDKNKTSSSKMKEEKPIRTETKHIQPDELIELLGINELKDALNDYAKHKAKKREVLAKVAEKDTPFYDTATKTFIGRFSHDINQVDQFFASRTETRIQRQLNQNRLDNP